MASSFSLAHSLRRQTFFFLVRELEIDETPGLVETLNAFEMGENFALNVGRIASVSFQIISVMQIQYLIIINNILQVKLKFVVS